MKNQLKLFSIILIFLFAAITGCVWDKSSAPVPFPPPPPPGACDTTNVTYDSTIVAILQINCYACHSASVASGGVILTNYNDVITVVNNGKL